MAPPLGDLDGNWYGIVDYSVPLIDDFRAAKRADCGLVPATALRPREPQGSDGRPSPRSVAAPPHRPGSSVTDERPPGHAPVAVIVAVDGVAAVAVVFGGGVGVVGARWGRGGRSGLVVGVVFLVRPAGDQHRPLERDAMLAGVELASDQEVGLIRRVR